MKNNMSFLKKLKIQLPNDSAIPLLCIHWEKTIIQKDTCTSVFTAALFTIARKWKQLKCPPREEWIKKMYIYIYTQWYIQFSSVRSLSCVRFFATAWIAARQASLSITNSQSSLRLTSIESVMPSSHLICSGPLLLLPPIPPSISLFQWVNSLHELAKVLEFTCT